MLGDHEGLPPLTDPDKAAQVMLRVLGRLKQGGDVPARRKVIARALQQVSPEDRHWMETLASRLSADGALDAIPAHLAAFAAAWELCDSEIAALIRSVNAAGRDPYSGQVMQGMIGAKPEIRERLMKGRIDSDEVMLRVAVSHIFRRDPGSTFQMFMVDGVVQQIPKAMKLSVQQVVRQALERFDDAPAPEGAWGYVLVLRDMHSRGGYFIFPPSEDGRRHLADLRGRLEGMLGPLEDDAFYSHVCAAAVSGHLAMGDLGGFAGLMSAVLEAIGERFVVLYAREDEGDGEREGGTHTQLIPIPAETPEEARRVGVRLPEVTMHDDMRALTEFLSQQRDMDAVRKD